MSDIISKKARTELREYFVGTSLAIIDREFSAADVPCDFDYDPPVGGQRRALVEQYYHAVDWAKWSEVRKILTIYENALISLEDAAEDGEDWAQKEFKSLVRWIERDGFRYERGRLQPVGTHPGLNHLSDTVGSMDLPELHRQLERLNVSVDQDPGLAIGTAKELVESLCKTILEERRIAFESDADITKLVKETRRALGLIPESIPDSAKGAESIRRLLSNLGSVTQGLAELRNLYGTGHGKDGTSRGLSPRHARLAVGAASTLATFLLETHLERGI